MDEVTIQVAANDISLFCRISCAIPVSMTMHPVLSHMPDCPLYSEDSTQIIQVHLWLHINPRPSHFPFNPLVSSALWRGP